MEVGVVTVIQKDVPSYGDWVATLDGYTNANIQPQVSGYLIRQLYSEGSQVHKDDVLFEIDPRPFQAALDQAKGLLAQAQGQLAQTEGQLAQAQSQLLLAGINVKRDTPLAQARAIAQSQLDNDTQAQAQADSFESKPMRQPFKQARRASNPRKRRRTGSIESRLPRKVRSLIDGIAGIASIQIPAAWSVLPSSYHGLCRRSDQGEFFDQRAGILGAGR